MIKQMLQAASKMLAGIKDPKVECAKIIIDELVSGMAPEIIPGETIEFDGPPHKGGKPVKKAQTAPKHQEPEVGVDRNQNLVEIKNVPLDGMVEITAINGAVSQITHAQAIGKPFRDIKILWRPE